MKKYALVIALLLLAACEQKDNSFNHPRFGGPFRPVDAPVDRQNLGVADPRYRKRLSQRLLNTEDGSDFVVGESYIYLGNGVFRCQKVIDVNESPE